MAKTSEYPLLDDPTGAALLATTSGGLVRNIVESKYARADNVVETVQSGPGVNVDNSDPRNPALSVDTDALFDKTSDTLDDVGDGSTYVRTTTADVAKIDHLTITGNIDLDAMKTKVDGIEESADVTDAANVTGVFNTGGAKDTFHNNDRFVGMNSESSNAPVYWLWSTIKAAVQAVTDALYITKPSAPGADRIVFWDQSAGIYDNLIIGANLSISDKTLNASGSGGGGGGDMSAAIYDPNTVFSDAFAMDNMAEGTNTKIMTAAERTKLSGIETAADVTDATNVGAAGAFMKSSDDLDDITEGTTNKHFTATEQTKLSGVSTGADVTSTAMAASASMDVGKNGTLGYLKLVRGSTGDFTGRVDFFTLADVRAGYIGWAASGPRLGLFADSWSGWWVADLLIGTSLHIGNTDTTLSRVSAGVVAIEGNNILTANLIGSSVQAYDAGNAPVKGKQGISIPAAAMVARSTNGAASFSTELATNDVMIRGFDFDTSTAEAVQALFSLPKQWNEGTVSFRAYWTAASGSGGVAFSLRARAASDDDAMDGSWGTAVTVTDTLITANDMHVTAESAAITIGGSPAEGDMIWIEVQREVANGSDTLAVDARLLGIEFFITTNAGTDA